MARRATAIRQLRQTAEGTFLLFDTGDTIFGRPPSDNSQGELPLRAMGLMGYQAMALGERDLGAPAEVLRERFEQAGFPILSANLGPADLLPLQPYILLEAEGHTIAIIGATATRAEQRSGKVGADLTVTKPLEAIPPLVEELRDQADVIILLSNLIQKTNLTLAQEVPGIDLILGTRDMTPPAQVQQVDGPDGRVVLQGSGQRGEQLAVLRVYFDEAGRVVRVEGEAILLNTQYADDPQMVQLLQEYGVK